MPEEFVMNKVSVSDLREMGIVSLEDIKGLEETLKSLKSELKETEKERKEAEKVSTIETVNGLIEDGSLNVQSRIKCEYDNKVIEAIVVTVPRLESDNITISSEQLRNKDKKLYLRKHKFVELV